MSWLTVVSSMVVAICLTLAVMHLVIWLKDRTSLTNLAFSFLATGAGLFTVCEFAMLRAETTEQIGVASQWLHVPIFMMVLGIAAFITLYFRTGRSWLAHGAWILKLITLVVNFVQSPNMDFKQITAVRRVMFLGEPVSIAEGVTSEWHWVQQVSFVLLACFVIDASVSLWRAGNRDDRRRAVMIGGATSLFIVAGAGAAALIFGGVIQFPHLEFIPFTGVLAAMAYELSSDVLRSARLTRELQASEAALRESETRMTMAADAARLGMWIWDTQANRIWTTDKCRELFAFPRAGEITFDDFMRRVHPDDRALRARAIDGALQTKRPYAIEYRLAFPDGGTRWITSHGRVECDASGSVVRILGVCIDTTEQREAEFAAQELSGRLINAQEDERRRIARDLHDDLNQRLALLSVELELLGREGGVGSPSNRAERVSAQLRELSSEVHNLSYQLHPAKLDQLGLVTAARSWCRDLSQQSGVRIEFTPLSVPLDVPADVSLCLYRILQESLRNVVRHSGSTSARVDLTGRGDQLQLIIEDTGRGFEMGAASPKGLGLVSMKERVRLLHGSIVIQSQPGRGTRVEVTVPQTHAIVNSRLQTDAAGSQSR